MRAGCSLFFVVIALILIGVGVWTLDMGINGYDTTLPRSGRVIGRTESDFGFVVIGTVITLPGVGILAAVIYINSKF